MKVTVVSVAEGKKSFSRLIHDAHRNKDEAIVTKRGKPIAVIVPYEEYQESKRVDGYRQIMAAREVLRKSGLSADDVYRESRSELETAS